MKCSEKCPWHASGTPLLKVIDPNLFKTCIVSKSKVVLFGGATGDTGKYIITGDTYTLDLISFKWTKLEGKDPRSNAVKRISPDFLLYELANLNNYLSIGSGIAPSPRAAHGSCSVDQLQMVVYGGATGGKNIQNLTCMS